LDEILDFVQEHRPWAHGGIATIYYLLLAEWGYTALQKALSNRPRKWQQGLLVDSGGPPEWYELATTSGPSLIASSETESAAAEPPPSPPRSGPLVFVCYSHKDSRFLRRLQAHCAPLIRSGLVAVWSDQKLRPGEPWRDKIMQAIDSAQVAVLLLSANFYESEFISSVELPSMLMKRSTAGLTVIPVICNHCRFERDPDLNGFQAICSPTRPMERLPHPEQERNWDELAKTLERLVNHQRPESASGL
jgi:TIR domain